MPIKRKAVATNPEGTKSKQKKRQSDIISGFASQVLRSPKKKHGQSASQISHKSLELDDEIEISDEEDRGSATQRPRSQIRLGASTQIGIRPTHGEFQQIKLEVVEENHRDHQGNPSSAEFTSGPAGDSLSSLENIKPRRLSDLAVHKAKVLEVQKWITTAFTNVVDQTVLIITGSAGVGKTATVEALALEMDFDVIEWKNPMSSEWSESHYDRDAESLAQKFDRFLAISDKYSVLDFGQGPSNTTDSRRKVILIEDIPNTFSSSGISSAKRAFQDSIKRYLSSPRNKYPLILIITETEPRGEDGDWRRSDAMSMRTLMTREILEFRNCKQITFNDIAPTFISKAMCRIVDTLPRAEALDLSQAVIDEIAQNANGDIRSAMNTLHFIAHKFRTDGKAPRVRRRKRRGEVLTLTANEEKILSIITNRESALGYFHAIGKVIYNKRIPYRSDPISYDDLADHLSAQSRLRPENDPSAIIDETSTDVSTFLMGIHQNYIDSCTDTDQAAGVLDALSDADYLTRSRELATLTPLAGLVAVSGVLQSLPQNAKRNHSTKVYFPAFTKLLKAQHKVQDLMDEYAQGTSMKSTLSLETIPYAWQIAQARGSASQEWRNMEKYKKVAQMNQFSSLGRGGIDEKAGLVEDDLGSQEKAQEKTREKALVGMHHDEVDDDDIEEID